MQLWICQFATAERTSSRYIACFVTFEGCGAPRRCVNARAQTADFCWTAGTLQWNPSQLFLHCSTIQPVSILRTTLCRLAITLRPTIFLFTLFNSDINWEFLLIHRTWRQHSFAQKKQAYRKFVRGRRVDVSAAADTSLIPEGQVGDPFYDG